MEVVSSIERIRVYIKGTTLLVFTFGIVTVLFFLLAAIHSKLAIVAVIAGLSTMIYYPFYIARKLQIAKRSTLLALPVALCSYALFGFKVMVNEYSWQSCLDGRPSFLHYFLFYCWTSLLLWELYIIVRAKLLPIN